jgi:C4-dicarboxylate transporter DctQ subunit
MLRKWTDRFAEWGNHIIAALLLSMFLVFLIQIGLRYVVSRLIETKINIDWTVEWVTIAWMWGILGSFAFVIRSGDMIRLDILYNAVPRPVQRIFDVAVGLITASIFAWTLPHAWDYVTFMGIERTAAFHWSFDFVFAIYIPFHIAVIVRMLLLAWSGIVGNDPLPDTASNPESHDYD